MSSYFTESYKKIVVAELLDGWEVSVLLLSLEWNVRIRVPPGQFIGKLILEHVSEDTTGQLAHLGRAFLSQLDHSQHVAPPLIGSVVSANAVFSSGDGMVNQILSEGAVDHNI